MMVFFFILGLCAGFVLCAWIVAHMIKDMLASKERFTTIDGVDVYITKDKPE
jgi:hypothetical protein